MILAARVAVHRRRHLRRSQPPDRSAPIARSHAVANRSPRRRRRIRGLSARRRNVRPVAARRLGARSALRTMSICWQPLPCQSVAKRSTPPGGLGHWRGAAKAGPISGVLRPALRSEEDQESRRLHRPLSLFPGTSTASCGAQVPKPGALGLRERAADAGTVNLDSQVVDVGCASARLLITSPVPNRFRGSAARAARTARLGRAYPRQRPLRNAARGFRAHAAERDHPARRTKLLILRRVSMIS